MPRSLTAVLLVVFLTYTGQFVAYPIIPLYVIEKGGSAFDVGTTVFLNLILAAVLAVPMGALSDRIGRRTVAIMGASAGTVAHLLLPFADTPLEILLAFAIAGVGHAGYGPSLLATIGEAASREKLATSFGWATVARQSGNFVGPAVGGFLASLYGLSGSFVACGLFQMVGGLAALVAVPPRSAGAGPSGRITKSSARAELRWALGQLGIVAPLVSTLMGAFAVQGYRSFIPLFAADLGADPSVIGILFTVQAIVNVVARVPFARYSDRTGRRAPFVTYGLLMMALSLGLLTLVPNVYVVMGWSAVMGIGLSMAMSASLAIVGERVHREARGAVFGLNNTSVYGGQGLGSIFTGFAVELYGFGVGFGLLAAFLLASVLSFFLMSRRAGIR